ncbi:MAG: hypothetical protein JSS42_11085 [Proteobacteria bacterium]|uniref:hypothetical protein n=1 Tax=Rudaea sp. TaxID=2136325 RepID=UPI0032202166|nr:hypothetical protein [Pseudomonadota bacterium]
MLHRLKKNPLNPRVADVVGEEPDARAGHRAAGNPSARGAELHNLELELVKAISWNGEQRR